MRRGIIVGGNWIIDKVKIIDTFPSQEALANILEEQQSNGGCAYNVLKDLAKLIAPFPLEGIGLIGEDIVGNYVIRDCNALGIDIRQLHRTSNAPTSYTDVMSVKKSGMRTFFHNRGANALLSIEHFNLKKSKAKIFLLGYFLLLDKLDHVDVTGRSIASYLLEEASSLGFITVADTVSENSNRFKEIIPSSLPFLDYLFINEYEASKLSGIEIASEGIANRKAGESAANIILQLGVRKAVIIHFPQASMAVTKTGETFFQPSLNVPAKYIRGTVGAGDAFAAGVLFALHENKALPECLNYGVCSAVSSLRNYGSSDGVMPMKNCLTLSREFGYLNFD